VEQAVSGARRTPDVELWAHDALVRLGTLPDVHRVGVALMEGGGRRLRFTASDRDGSNGVDWCHVDAYDDLPLNTAVRTAEPVIDTIDGLEVRYAEFAAQQRDTLHVALAAVPLVDQGRVLGGFVLFYDQPQAFGDGHRRALLGLGEELGAELGRLQRAAQRRPRAIPDLPVPPGAAVAVHEVPGDLAAVGQARRSIRRTLAAWGLGDDQVDSATLALSELITNAVLHAHGGCVVRVVLADGVLLATVRDGGVAGVVPAGPVGDPLRVHGRGLQVVEALTSRWGHDVGADGTTVWFELDVG
jgi:anti-sigma regulatory factor (Ser/Thr protein kinase)